MKLIQRESCLIYILHNIKMYILHNIKIKKLTLLPIRGTIKVKRHPLSTLDTFYVVNTAQM